MTEKKKLSPIVSEFETEEEAEAHDTWFRKKVQRAIDDQRPDVPHDEAMAEVAAVIKAAAAAAKKKRA
ncbi:MAG: type II toxin-antitoxin system RelB family antitoxin [Devosia sp.]